MMSRENRYKEMCSDQGLEVETQDGELIVVKINNDGIVSLASSLNPDHGGLGSFVITGLDPQEAAAKKKSFWGRLWSKIKEVAGAVLDAVTVPVFGYRCRPHIDIDFRNRGISIGISCKEV